MRKKVLVIFAALAAALFAAEGGADFSRPDIYVIAGFALSALLLVCRRRQSGARWFMFTAFRPGNLVPLNKKGKKKGE